MSDRAARTLVIVPALNEEDSLPAVLSELRSHHPDLAVLVVDDGSTDATAAVARDNGARVVRLPFNLGVGAALRTGFLYALRNGYDRAVQVDGDGQHDPAEIGALLAGLDAGGDLVVGSRFVESTSDYAVGRVRRTAMRSLTVAVGVLSGQRFSDISSGFRAFSGRLLEFYARRYPMDYLGDTAEALLMACYAGFRVTEVQVHMRHRAAGTPSNGSVKLAYHYLRALVTMVTTAQLRRRTPREANP